MSDLSQVSVGSRGRPESFFERRPFPKFNGSKRNYPSFKREWRECISKSFKEEFQLREIKRCVPKEIELDLKNLRSMKEVWDQLQEEY